MNDITMEDVMVSKKVLAEKITTLEKKIRILESERRNLWLARSNVMKHLNHMCDHDWKREGYPYSPLYCIICGVER